MFEIHMYIYANVCCLSDLVTIETKCLRKKRRNEIYSLRISCLIHVATSYLACQSIRIWYSRIDHTLRNEMGQPAAYIKNPLERSKWAAIVEMTVFTKDGIEVQNLRQDNSALKELTDPLTNLYATKQMPWYTIYLKDINWFAGNKRKTSH